MSDELAQVGLYLDEFNKIRIIDPIVFAQANDLKDNYKIFDES